MALLKFFRFQIKSEDSNIASAVKVAAASKGGEIFALLAAFKTSATLKYLREGEGREGNIVKRIL